MTAPVTLVIPAPCEWINSNDRDFHVCGIPECGKRVYARSVCKPHYNKMMRSGEMIPLPVENEESRFWSHVDVSGECWLWTGATTNGYGVFRSNGRAVRAHRWAWEQKKGPILHGLVLDHICHNPRCVRVTHLRPGTDKQNGENRGSLNSNNKSGYRGVSWSRSKRKWIAQVSHNRRSIQIGAFDDVKEAAEAARDARNQIFKFNDLDRTVA